MRIPLIVCIGSVVALSAIGMAAETMSMSNVLPKVALKEPSFRTSRSITDEEYVKLTTLACRPMRSPMTKQVVNVPLASEDPSSSDIDADLCQHWSGKVNVYTPIVLDPWSGFACYREHFGKPLPAPMQQWVRKTLTPRLKGYICSRLNNRIPVSNGLIQDFFNRQEHLSDTVRCTHALAYYTQSKAPSSVRARLAWLSAWAYRRSICMPVEGPFLMKHLRKVLTAMDSDKAAQVDVQKRINRLAEMYRREETYCPQERQIIGITLAQYYDRLGAPGWARACLQSVVRECKDARSSAVEEAWSKSIPGAVAERRKTIAAQRNALAEEAGFRLKQLAYEMKYMGMAASLIRETLASNRYPPEKISFFTYLVGEFERRRENFGAAKVWLDAASLMLTKNKEANYAAEQLAVLKEYYSRLETKPDLNYAEYPADYKLLQAQIARSGARRAQPGEATGGTEDVRTNVPPASGVPLNDVQLPR